MSGYFIFDLDSTLADTRHRHKFADKVKAGEATWEQYSKMCVDDVPYPGVVKLAQTLSKLGKIIILTGRDNVAHDETVQQLKDFGVVYNVLRMRSPNDPYGSVDYKVGIIKEWLALGFEIELVVEDWPPIIDALEALGVPCLCVNPRYEEANPESDKPSFGV